MEDAFRIPRRFPFNTCHWKSLVTTRPRRARLTSRCLRSASGMRCHGERAQRRQRQGPHAGPATSQACDAGEPPGGAQLPHASLRGTESPPPGRSTEKSAGRIGTPRTSLCRCRQHGEGAKREWPGSQASENLAGVSGG